MATSTLDQQRPLVLDGTDPTRLRESVRERFGDSTAHALERMDVKRASLGGQEGIVQEVDATHPSVDSRELVNAYGEGNRQLETKREVLSNWYDAPDAQPVPAEGTTPAAAEGEQKVEGEDRWYHKLGRGLKATVMAPVNAVGWAFKNYPVTSTVATTALAIYLAYQFGIPMAGYAGGGADAHTAEVAEAVRNLGNFNAGLPVDTGRVVSQAVEYGGVEGAVEGLSQLP